MRWTPNKVTLLRVVVGFAAVCLFGRGAWANLTAVGLTVAAIALDVLDGLASLVDKSLVRQEVNADGEPRFSMLETIREFALECLVPSSAEERVRRAHATYYLALTQQAESQRYGREEAAWLVVSPIARSARWANSR